MQNLFIYNIDVENNYTLNKDNPKFSIFNYNIEDNSKSNSILEVNCKLLYDYTDYKKIYFLLIFYKLISCGLDIKLLSIYLLSLKLFMSSFNCNTVCNFPFFKDIR